jgi:integrase
LRGILKHFGLWGVLADRVRLMKGEGHPGRALSREEESRLVIAIRESGSPVLYPLFVLSIDTGLRASEVRALKRWDVNLLSRHQASESAEIVVPKSKTEAGTGRVVPLTRRAYQALREWLNLIGEGDEDAFLFPRHAVGFRPRASSTAIHNIDFTQPVAEWKSAWRSALKNAKVKVRWHDLRHTLVSRLAENPAVSEETIRALAGHVSRAMLSRYSHNRTCEIIASGSSAHGFAT